MVLTTIAAAIRSPIQCFSLSAFSPLGNTTSNFIEANVLKISPVESLDILVYANFVNDKSKISPPIASPPLANKVYVVENDLVRPSLP
mgnify:CR=1 FL=1